VRCEHSHQISVPVTSGKIACFTAEFGQSLRTYLRARGASTGRTSICDRRPRPVLRLHQCSCALGAAPTDLPPVVAAHVAAGMPPICTRCVINTRQPPRCARARCWPGGSSSHVGDTTEDAPTSNAGSSRTGTPCEDGSPSQPARERGQVQGIATSEIGVDGATRALQGCDMHRSTAWLRQGSGKRHSWVSLATRLYKTHRDGKIRRPFPPLPRAALRETVPCSARSERSSTVPWRAGACPTSPGRTVTEGRSFTRTAWSACSGSSTTSSTRPCSTHTAGRPA
jgi:hypothetical protein